MGKEKRKPKYNVGSVYEGKRETITVRKIYPPGHRYATKDHYCYLIHSTDIGEDELPECRLTQLIAVARSKNAG